MGLDVAVRNVENPRIELEEHYYNPDHQHLLDLGYQPTAVEAEMRVMLADLIKYRAHRGKARRADPRHPVGWHATPVTVFE